MIISKVSRSPSTWPTFMLKDPVANPFFGQLADACPDPQLLAPASTERAHRQSQQRPLLPWGGRDDELPERGWDAILERGLLSSRPRASIRQPSRLLEARIVPHHQHVGLSRARW